MGLFSRAKSDKRTLNVGRLGKALDKLAPKRRTLNVRRLNKALDKLDPKKKGGR